MLLKNLSCLFHGRFLFVELKEDTKLFICNVKFYVRSYVLYLKMWPDTINNHYSCCLLNTSIKPLYVVVLCRFSNTRSNKAWNESRVWVRTAGSVCQSRCWSYSRTCLWVLNIGWEQWKVMLRMSETNRKLMLTRFLWTFRCLLGGLPLLFSNLVLWLGMYFPSAASLHKCLYKAMKSSGLDNMKPPF